MELISRLSSIVIDMIYPRHCPSCGNIVVPKGELICGSCVHSFELIKEPRCMKCSKPIDNEESEFCFDCLKNHYHYKNGMAIWVYNKQMRKSIADFKYKGRKEYVDYYSSMIIKLYGHKIEEINPDVLVPIPMHPKKERERGYNQAALIAKEIGKQMNIHVSYHLLVREKYTIPQKQLSNVERIKNLERAFSFSQKELMKLGKSVYKIMLIDDIYTTGSTIEACCRILIKNGINDIYFFSLSIGKGF